jgi:hypothetical protein
MNEGEKKLMFYRRGMEGSFYTALFDAIYKADNQNKERLRKGFPEEVDAVFRVQNEPGYAENLEKEFNGAL